LPKTILLLWPSSIRFKRYLAFASRGQKNVGKPDANIGVVTDSYQKSYEPINLLARHNIPFAVLKASDLKPQSLDRCDLLVVFATMDVSAMKALADFASKAALPWWWTRMAPTPGNPASQFPQASIPLPTTPAKAVSSSFQGQVIDPETFAQDIRRLLDQHKKKLALSLWNALTVVAVSYQSPGGGEKVVELVNYAESRFPSRCELRDRFLQFVMRLPSGLVASLLLQPSVGPSRNLSFPRCGSQAGCIWQAENPRP
jgi:hypothetical protein